MRYQHIIEFVAGSAWAITAAKLSEIVDFLAIKAAGEDVDPAEVEAIVAARQRSTPQGGAAVAVLPLWGTLLPRASGLEKSSGATSVEEFTATFRAAVAEPSVSAVVVSVDSPGGSVAGIEELATEVYRARRGPKPVVAVADSMMASAAYWAMSGAGEIVATPTAITGSVGVLAVHQDVSKALEQRGVKTTLITHGANKGEGSPFEPLSDEARAHMQEMVSFYGDLFERAIARGRGIPVSRVRAEFGQGRVFHTAKARQVGMIDRVATLDQVVQELASGRWQRPERAELVEAEPVQEADETVESSAAAAVTLAVGPSTAGPSIAMRRRRLRYLAS